jgi:hypothetical protein
VEGWLRLRGTKIQLFWFWDKGIPGIQNHWSIIGITIKQDFFGECVVGELGARGGVWGRAVSQDGCGNGSKTLHHLSSILLCEIFHGFFCGQLETKSGRK